MSIPTTETADAAEVAPLPADLLAAVAACRRSVDAAEVEVLRLATLWADAHPADVTGAGDSAVEASRRWDVPQPVPAREVTDAERVALSEYHPSLLGPDGQLVDPAGAAPLATGDGADADDPTTWAAIPALAWDAPAAFAAANHLSTSAGKALIRDALVLRHRLPKTWAQVLAGRVTAWRARRIAQVVLGAPVDVVKDIDARLAPVAGSIGPVALANLLDAAMIRLHAEIRELDHIADLDRRSVVLDQTTMTHTGLAELVIRSEWADLKDLEATIARLAAALTDPAVAAVVAPRLGLSDVDLIGETLQVRRALAAGLLADPEGTADLFRLVENSGDDDPAATGTPTPRAPASRRQVDLVVHLTDLTLAGLDPLTRVETLGPVLLERVRAWCARTDTAVRIRPVIDLDDVPAPAECFERDVYDITDRLRDAVGYLHPTCVHPYCERPAAACDLDHTDAWPAGPTCVHNLAPLCRHHHRLKTHTAWTYRPLDPLAGSYLWTDPRGQTFLVDHTGTHALSPPEQCACRHRSVGSGAVLATAPRGDATIERPARRRRP